MGGGDTGAAANDGGPSKNEKDSGNQSATEVISGGDGSVGVKVNIRSSNGSKFSVQVTLDSTVGSFKNIIATQSEIPAEQQRLIYKGRILKDDQTLESYGLEAEHTVHLVKGFATAAPANTAPATNTNPVNTGSNDGGPYGASMFPGLNLNGLGNTGGGGGGLFGAGFPEFEQVQQQLSQNPNMMRDMMNMPMVQNLMNNPEIMRNMVMNNPQMREIIDRNPELGHILNDPATLRQTMEAARNPEIMREMMRNTDRAMSNIEASPEGFNMLRRMYENVQEPLLNATTMSGDTGHNVGPTNPFAALLGSQGTTGTGTNPPAPNTNPLPNPWAPAPAGGAQTNTTTRPVGGLGIDPSSMNNLMQNPAMSQMMQSLLSNPQYMNQILGMNPALRSTLDSNPQLREMMQNPDFIRQLTSPDMLQQLMSLQQTLTAQLGQRQATVEPGQTGGGAVNTQGMEMLMNMFSGLGTGGLTANTRPSGPPEEIYATQLGQLQEMGFFDTQENIRALMATAGNVNAAVERLLGGQ